MIPLAEVWLLCSILNLTVGIMLYGENPKHGVNRSFLLLSGVLFYWGFTEFEYMKAYGIQTALFWMRLGAFWYLLPAVALDFAIIYATLKVKRLFRFLFLYCPAILLSLFEYAAIPYHLTEMPWGWDSNYSGYFGYVVVLWTIFPTVVALFILFRRYSSAESHNERIGVGYVFSGLFVPIIVGVSTIALQVLASIDLPDLTVPAAAVGFLLVGYGVVRYGSYILTANAAADDILSTMADSLFLVNSTGKIIVSNEAASKLLEYETSELTGRRLSTLVSDPISIDALLDESSTIFESHFKTKQGRIIPVSLSKSEILTRAGDPIGYVIICRDITARKQVEQALRESEDKYRRLFEGSPISLWEEDFSGVKKYLDELRGRGVRDFRAYFMEHPGDVAMCSGLVKILDVNRATLTLYNAKNVSEFLSGLSKVLTKESSDNFREEIVALAEGKTMFESEFINQTLAGEVKYTSVIVSVVPGYEGTLGKVLVSIIDLTEYKLMEERLLKSERLAAIGEASAMVGHDLRNPLQGLAATIYLLREQCKITAENRWNPDEYGTLELLNMADRSVEYMDKIVSDLQNYSKPLRPENVPVNAAELLNETISNIRMPPDVKLSINVTGDLQMLTVDPALMRWAFTNLITNALQAMPNGGELKIGTRKTLQETLISFRDTGVGISPENLPNIFQPFRTTKAQGQGLGLAVCKRIVEAHGGSITVNSTVGEGSTFTIRLPNCQAVNERDSNLILDTPPIASRSGGS
jgi:PAS domain S-box-containing protein